MKLCILPRIGLPIIFLSLLPVAPSYGALGGNTASIRSDAQALGTRASIATHLNYSRYDISQGWINLHEFTGPRGEVFALSWNGRRHPNLRALLGVHFRDFQSALAQARREGRRGGAIVVDSPDFHLEIGGHMMAVYGSIWLKKRIPAGMSLDEIR